MPNRESQYYGLPTYTGEYHPKPYYYSHGPSYRYYDDRGSKPANNPLDDLHEQIQQEDARERQREEMERSYYGEDYQPTVNRPDTKLTSAFLKNLIAYNKQMNEQNEMPNEMVEPQLRPEELAQSQYGLDNGFDGSSDIVYEPLQEMVTHQKPQNRHRQSKKPKKPKQNRKPKQNPVVYNVDDQFNVNANQDENSLYSSGRMAAIQEVPVAAAAPVDADEEALKSLAENNNRKKPKGQNKNNRNRSGKKQNKQRQQQRQEARKEKERREREMRQQEEQREQQRLADKEQLARRELLAKQQNDERQQQQELQQQQRRREQLLIQQQFQSQIPPQYSDYQQEPSTMAEVVVEPEYDESWSSWDRKRSQLPLLQALAYESLSSDLSDAIEQKAMETTTIAPITTSTTISPSTTTTTNGAVVLSRSARVPVDGQKEVMVPRPSNPLRHPFSSPIMEMLTHNALESEQETEKEAVSRNAPVEQDSGSSSSKINGDQEDPSVYDTIKHLMALKQSLNKVSGLYTISYD